MVAAAPKGRSSQGKPGRPLPTKISDFTNKQLNDDAKLLSLRLITLATGRFGSITNMARAAMAVAGAGKLHWAKGTPDDPAQVREAGKRVSAFLGRAARQPVDWPTVEWLVQVGAPEDERKSTLAEFAGLWCMATGTERPPRYTGEIKHEQAGRPELTDPDLAGDDATRAELHRKRWVQAMAQLQELDQQIRDRDIRIADLTRERDGQVTDLARREDMAQTELRLVRAECAKLDAENSRLRGNLSQCQLRVQHEQTALAQVANQLERAETQMARLSHHLGVVVAHVLARGNKSLLTPGQILPTGGLKMDPVLRSLLDVNLNPKAGPMTRWLAVYLRSLLSGMSSLRLLATEPGLDDELNMVVTGNGLPSDELLAKLTGRYTFVKEYGVALRQAALRDNEHRSQTAAASPTARSAAVPEVLIRPGLGKRRPRAGAVTVAELSKKCGPLSALPGLAPRRKPEEDEDVPEQVLSKPGGDGQTAS